MANDDDNDLLLTDVDLLELGLLGLQSQFWFARVYGQIKTNKLLLTDVPEIDRAYVRSVRALIASTKERRCL